jgi:hypothetical protein
MTGAPEVSWRLTIISQGVVLFTASTRSRQEIEALAAEASSSGPAASPANAGRVNAHFSLTSEERRARPRISRS